MTRDPVRWCDPASGAPVVVRDLIRSAAGDEPTSAQLDGLAARLGARLGTSPAIAVATRIGGVAARKVWVIAAVVGVVVVGAGYYGRTTATTEPSATITPAAPVAAPVVPPVAAPAPAALEPAAPAPAPSPPGRPRPAHRDRAPLGADQARAPTVPADPVPIELDDEATILGEAQRALVAGDPADALAQVDRHADQFPSGVLREEREAIAIEALARVGRHIDARTRFDRFGETYPRSTYRHRLTRLFDVAP